MCPAANKSKGKANESKETEPPHEPLPQGLLEVHLDLPVSSATRDWLQSGIRLQLWQVVLQAHMQPLTDEQKLALADPKKKGKAGELHTSSASVLSVLYCLSEGVSSGIRMLR